jgi:ABC-type Fe3+/spermidine/putrescine transport system ATPase subunit
MGESNVFQGSVRRKKTGDQVDVDTVFGRRQIAGDAAAGETVVISIRPEQIHADTKHTRLDIALGEVEVEEVSFFGTHHRCRGRHAKSGQSLIIRLPQHQAAQVGEILSVSVARVDIVLLVA